MTQSKVVAFIKGTPDAPRCGFSRQVVALLREHEVNFTHFDILTDEDVRQGMHVHMMNHFDSLCSHLVTFLSQV